MKFYYKHTLKHYKQAAPQNTQTTNVKIFLRKNLRKIFS